MSGSNARRGFRYQDLYLLSRVLLHVRDIFRAVWRAGGHEVLAALEGDPLRFGIEAKAYGGSADGSDAPWDVTIADASEEEIIEAKSGEIQRPDRLVFWARLRRSFAAHKDQASRFVPTLVADPDAETMDKWRGLADAALHFAGSVTASEPNAPVRSSPQLLDEALFVLCTPAADPQTLPIEVTVAIKMLSRFRLYERRSRDLQDEIDQHLTLLFPDGPTDVFAGHLRDWLDNRASSIGDAAKRFGIGTVMREVSVVREATTLDRGTWRRWQDLRKEWRAIVRSKATGHLGAGGGAIPIEKVQPAIAATLSGGNGGKLLIGGGGAGKTTLLVMFDRELSDSAESWLVPAANLSESELDDLAAAIRFAAALATVNEQVWLFVDGLDEIESAPEREHWGKILARLAVHPPVQVAATIRNADWERDTGLRAHLGLWGQFLFHEWPEEIVRELLAATSYGPHVPAGLLSLLRTPIMLDLFWRTFVEAQPSGPGTLHLPMTRYQLLSAFWADRLVHSSRHTKVVNRPACFDPIFEAAAHTIATFEESGLDHESLNALASEAVLVNVGRLRPQWQFRHPFLRDFALAQWCLAANSAQKVAQRWKHIVGAIPRQGALRGILEALTEKNSAREYPNVHFEELAASFVFESDESRSAFARAVGALPASTRVDPVQWSAVTQSRLSVDFGSELVGAVRREGNLTWATVFADWPDDAVWLNDGFVREANSYLRLFLAGRREATEQEPARTDGARLARTVRRWSESARFRSTFEGDTRWQKHFAIESIAALLPDRETLEWLAREVPQATWLTQSAILDNLRFVAHADPAIAADVYRGVVGLHREDNRWALDDARWSRDISHNALDRSLTGPNANVSLVCAFPEAFLPVTLEMAEAIHWRDEKQRHDDDEKSGLLQAIWTHRSVQDESKSDELPDMLGDLVDDLSRWHFQSRDSPCQKAVREAVEQVAAKSPEHFTVRTAPILAACRLASMQGIALEVATKHAGSLCMHPVIAASLLDRRLFHVPGLLPAIESAVPVAWQNLSVQDQERVLSNIETTAASPHYRGPVARKTLLSAIPLDALNSEQRCEVEAYREEELQRRERHRRTEGLPENFSRWQRDEHSKRAAADWPEEIDRDKLEDFHVLYSALLNPSTDGGADNSIQAQALILELWPSIIAHPNALDGDNAWWMWHALHILLQTLRKPLSAKTKDSDTLLRHSAELALLRLEAGAKPAIRESQEGDNAISADNAWMGALELANEALIHPELANATILTARFGETVAREWRIASPGQQVDIIHHVTFLRHWRQIAPLRALTEGPLWKEPLDARPIVAALALIPDLQEPEREGVLRLALNRTGLKNADKLAQNIGGLLGEYAMVTDQGGRRPALLSLISECVSTPERFPLLEQTDTQRAFFYQLAFGMKQQAKHYAEHVELAADFARWNLSAWNHMHQLPPSNDHRMTGVALFALYWLGDVEQPVHTFEVRSRWWRELQPLRDMIVREGNARDLFHFFFLFYHGKLLDLCRPAEMFRLIDDTLNRMKPLLEANIIELQQTKPEDPEPRHWRETLDHIADTIDSLRKIGALDATEPAEVAHSLLIRLSAAPFKNDKAKDVLHRLVS